jgi:hypothetical protein
MANRLIDRINQRYLCNRQYYTETYTDEAIEYIKLNIAPYLDELDSVTNGNFTEIIERYPQDVKDKISKTGRGEFSPEEFQLINQFKIDAMNHLMDSIISDDEDSIDPWDVEFQFRFNEIPRELFRLQPLTYQEKHNETPLTVDVDVTINDRKFAHSMSRFLVKGIIAYYKAFGLQHPLSLGGKTFHHETDEIIGIDLTNIKDQSLVGYTVEVNGVTHKFGSVDFIRGLITANQWVNNGSTHSLITNLNQYQGGVIIPLTF